MINKKDLAESLLHTDCLPPAAVLNFVPHQAPPTSLNLSSAPKPPKDAVPCPLVEPVDLDRPERMRDWLVRMIESGRFPGLKWLDSDMTVFRVPWIHAKKRDYNQERDAALFREWAIHSGGWVGRQANM